MSSFGVDIYMREEGLCPCCLGEVESVAHSLRSCPLASDVWLESDLNMQKWDCYFRSHGVYLGKTAS